MKLGLVHVEFAVTLLVKGFCCSVILIVVRLLGSIFVDVVYELVNVVKFPVRLNVVVFSMLPVEFSSFIITE